MKKLHKTLIVSIVSVLTFSLGATPALAAPFQTELSTADGLAAIGPQSLNTTISTAATMPADQMLAVETAELSPSIGSETSSEIGSGIGAGASTFDAVPALGASATHGFDVDAAIALAQQEVGTSRATGWSQPGECIMSAQRWVRAGGGNWLGGGTPVTNYDTAARLPVSQAQPGDIIQYEHMLAPHAWVSGVHTLMITGVNGDGTFSIIQSNVPFGSGLVTEVESWTPEAPFGFQAVAWRF